MRIHSYIKGQRVVVASKYDISEAASEKISKLVIRISSFTLLYIIPLIIGELCTYYQAINMDSWLTSWYSTKCLHAQRSAFGFTQTRDTCPILEARNVHNTPKAALFFIKYVSYFTVGIACAIWTINGKTFNSYADFYARVFYGRTRVPVRPH